MGAVLTVSLLGVNANIGNTRLGLANLILSGLPVSALDRLARLAKVYVFALDIYKDSNDVREFLNRPYAMLDGRPPLDVALETGPGTDAVINLLGRIAYSGGV